MKKATLPALVLTLALTFALWENRPSVDAFKDVGATLAASLANREAYARFGVSPFSPGQGGVTIDHGQWTWTAMKGHGYSDLQATVVVANGKSSVTINQTVLGAWE